MSKIDQSFLRDVQRAGWIVDYADKERVLALCPRAGCRLRVTLSPGKSIPMTCASGPDLAEVSCRSFDDARVFLRDRRESLCLVIKDVELAAGLADDHLAKFEKDDPARIPNAQTFIEWVQTLGYVVVLRPADEGLPAATLRVMAETRDRVPDRRVKFSLWAKRRLLKADPQEPRQLPPPND